MAESVFEPRPHRLASKVDGAWPEEDCMGQLNDLGTLKCQEKHSLIHFLTHQSIYSSKQIFTKHLLCARGCAGC